MCIEPQRFLSRWTPNYLNVVTHSTTCHEVKRGGKMIEMMEPRITSLVLDVLHIIVGSPGNEESEVLPYCLQNPLTGDTVC